jgi:uncharacterized protein
MIFALLYEPVDDYVARRVKFRAGHLALAERWRAGGRLLAGGAFEPPDGALLVFRADSAEEVEAFVREDPYVRNGLVTRWRVREWKVVVGDLAAPASAR